MFVDTTIYGYTIPGGAFHPGCLPESYKPEQHPEVHALFNWDLSEWDQLSCDACGLWIVEPDSADEDEDEEPGTVLAEPVFDVNQLALPGIDWTTAPGSPERRESVRTALAARRALPGRLDDWGE